MDLFAVWASLISFYSALAPPLEPESSSSPVPSPTKPVRLMLDYHIGAASIARSLASYTINALELIPFLKDNIPSWVGHGSQVHLGVFSFNLLAPLLLVILTMVLCWGVGESSVFNAVVTVTKVDASNWTPFAPHGFKSILTGATVVFFAYVGFDAVANSAEESKRPQRDLPLGIVGILLVCIVLYIGVCLVITGMVPYNLLGEEAPLAHAFKAHGLTYVSVLISVGAIAGLTTTLLVGLYVQSRLYLGLGRDGLLPSLFAKVHPARHTPVYSQVWVGIVAIILAGLFNVRLLSHILSVGSLKWEKRSVRWFFFSVDDAWFSHFWASARRFKSLAPPSTTISREAMDLFAVWASLISFYSALALHRSRNLRRHRLPSPTKPVRDYLVFLMHSVMPKLASRFPAVVGGAYLYTYTAFSELMAFLVFTQLMLDYHIGAASIARSLASYTINALELIPFLKDNIPSWVGMAANSTSAVILTMVLCWGVGESSVFNAVVTVTKVVIVFFVIIVGAFKVDASNWTPFTPHGFKGILTGATVVFFAYVGFDAVANSAEESKRPQRDLPLGIVGSLLVCIVLYIGVCLVITGMVPYNLLGEEAPLAHAFKAHGLTYVSVLISVGAIAGLTTTLLVGLYVQARHITHFLPFIWFTSSTYGEERLLCRFSLCSNPTMEGQECGRGFYRVYFRQSEGIICLILVACCGLLLEPFTVLELLLVSSFLSAVIAILAAAALLSDKFMMIHQDFPAPVSQFYLLSASS
nr:cationic amino acid transporter 9, chloroplastic [Ipomoea batatas]